MSTESERGPILEIPAGDEEWKKAVQAENRALEETLKNEKPAGSSAAGGAGPSASEGGRESPRAEKDEPRLPDADFFTLVTMLSTQAMVGLGLLPHPSSGKPEPERELARHFIDLLGVLEQKTRGNLDADEHQLLEGTLHDLRMAFVRQA